MKLTERALTHLRNQGIALLRIGVQGGGCSGFQYLMEEPGFGDRDPRPTDKVFEPEEGLKIYVDPVSYMYLSECEVDYVSSLEMSGFQFNNAQAKSTCGCGKSFSS
jgi:iron-sulfur cluster assembly accessory protein